MIDTLKHRLLCHAVFDPQLDLLTSNTNSTITVPLFSSSLCPLTNRLDIAIYMPSMSAKLSWLAGRAYHVIKCRGRKLLFFCMFPLTLLNTLTFPINLGYSCLTIAVSTVRLSGLRPCTISIALAILERY